MNNLSLNSLTFLMLHHLFAFLNSFITFLNLMIIAQRTPITQTPLALTEIKRKTIKIYPVK